MQAMQELRSTGGVGQLGEAPKVKVQRQWKQ